MIKSLVIGILSTMAIGILVTVVSGAKIFMVLVTGIIIGAIVAFSVEAVFKICSRYKIVKK